MAVAFLKSTTVASPPPKSPGCPYTDDYEVEIRATSDKQALTQHARRLETVIRNALAEQNHDRIGKIVWQLCHDYAYAVHQPHARNGGLIGLAAAAIALGPVSGDNGTRFQATADIAQEVARYLKQIVPPVLVRDSFILAPRSKTMTMHWRQLHGNSNNSYLGMLLRPRCSGQILCLREHVQHRQGGQR